MTLLRGGNVKMVDRLVNSSLNAQRITNVENCFGSSGQPLAVTGRVLVGEGVLTKMCRKKPKPRQFFLFNDILVYGNIVINKKKYNKQHIIPLEEVKLENLSDDDVMKNGWLIRTPTKSFAVYAATATEKSEWMAHINKCLEELLNKTGKKPSTEHAAVWVPDAEANTCMHCRKAQFSFINRRHHCRKCGSVVCGMCSNKKFLLPSQSTKPLRVCLSCYDTLSKARVDFPPEPQKVDKPAISPVQFPATPDSSGDDDSDYEDEDDHEDANQKRGIQGEDVNKDLEQLYIEEKPTFYGDHEEQVKSEDIMESQPALVTHKQQLTRNTSEVHENSRADLVTLTENSIHHVESVTESSTFSSTADTSPTAADSSTGHGEE